MILKLGNQWGDANGFERLRKFDGNGDNKIDTQDVIFGELKIWQDKNHNGKTDSGELKTLSETGIQQINLDYQESEDKDRFGNELRQQSVAVNQDGSERQAIDAWLRTT